MSTLKAIPDSVTLTCHNPNSHTTVRIRTGDNKPDIDITALGYDPAVASLNPPGGKTNKAGYLDITVKCLDGGPCPAETAVTFDAQGYDSSTLKIACSDHQAALTLDTANPLATSLLAFIDFAGLAELINYLLNRRLLARGVDFDTYEVTETIVVKRGVLCFRQTVLSIYQESKGKRTLTNRSVIAEVQIPCPQSLMDPAGNE
jgi:hypothetical protein